MQVRGLKKRMDRPGFMQVISAYGFAERHHRDLDELEMLAGKRNTNDGKGKQQSEYYMHQRRVQPAAEQPDNIKENGKATRVA